MGVLWGMFEFKANIEREVASLAASQQSIIQKLDSEQRIAKLERTAAIQDVIVRVSAIETQLEASANNFVRIWPRLRAVDTNIRKLEQAILQVHPDTKVNLVDPQEF